MHKGLAPRDYAELKYSKQIKKIATWIGIDNMPPKKKKFSL